jgi:hypothetical protein
MPKSAKKKQPTPADGRIIVENVNVPGYTQSVDATMYEAMKQAILKILPAERPGLTQTEIRAGVVAHLPKDLYPNGAKSDWWAKLVQLDLEAKEQLVRERSKPLRWHRAK